MSSQDRRRFLKRAGTASIAGLLFATGGASTTTGRAPDAAAEGAAMRNEHSSELPADPDEYETEHWPSFRADAGNTGYVAADHEFDECVRYAWKSDTGGGSIANDTMYSSRDRVSALAVEDGTVEWESDDIAARGATTAAYDTVFVGGGELTALDARDGSVRWQSGLEAATSTLEPGPAPIPTPTVAYGAVYVVVDGTLYAFEVSDGSIRWTRESVTVSDDQDQTEMTFDRSTVAAVNESVYAAVDQGVVALDPVTGETVWTNTTEFPLGPVIASSDLVAVRSTNGNLHLYDAETGESTESLGNFFLPSIGDDVAVTTSELSVSATDLESGDGLWSIEGLGTQSIGPPTVVGETVYVYFSGRTDQYPHSVVAVDKYDGTVKRTIELSGDPRDASQASRRLMFSDGTLYVSGFGPLIALR